ncbi:hypothetical protein VB002_04535 [Campylobacter concisus]
MKVKPKIFILDVYGVMTDGKFYYSADGKIMKILDQTTMMLFLC